MFQITQSTNKLLQLKKRIRCVCGGTSASKTISILMILIDYSQTNFNKTIDVVSQSYPHLEGGAIKDFKAIMIDRKYWNSNRWNETKHFYTFETGTILKFMSVENVDKAHGPRRDVLFINEAPPIPFDIYEALEVRTNEIIWMDWNPTNEFWYYTELKDRINHDFITLTYLDCLDVLPLNIIQSIENRKNRRQWWLVYGLGQLGEVEGRIYKGWKQIEEIPHEAKMVRRGLDFGYTNDPSALVAIYKYNGAFILDEELYQRGMHNKPIADIILNLEEAQTLVVADSAEPKSIDEIRSYGVNILGCKKGKNLKKQGIDYVQEQKIFVTKRSFNIWKEYNNYLWERDKAGKQINEPQEGFNHAMDAIRYGFDRYKPTTIKEYHQPAYEGISDYEYKGQTRELTPNNLNPDWELEHIRQYG